ncbi:MAG: hypothetical protein AABY43_04255 [Candidatus Omnitrophota bacterium]
MINYLKIFLTAFCSALILTPIIKNLALKFNFVSFPKEDRWHRKPTAILGGVAIFMAVMLGLIPVLKSSDKQIFGFFIGSALMFTCGVIDDIKKLAPQVKILFQIIASCIVIYFGISIRINPVYLQNLPPPFVEIIDILVVPLTIIWIIGITNAFNLLDNMDGLCAGIAAISSLMLFMSGLFTANLLISMTAICLAGACFGFLPFNFNSAKIFMGDSGSMFLGFSLSLIALMGTSARTFSNLMVTLAIPVFILAVPIFDTTLVTLIRTINGRSILKGGKDHTSHRLVSLGLSEKKTVVLLYIISILFGVIALAYSRLDVLVVSVFAVLILIVLFFLGMFLSEVKTYNNTEIEAARRRKIDEGKVILNTFIFNKRKIAEVIIDFLLICAAYYSAYLLRFEGSISGHNAYLLKTSLPWVIIIKLASFYYFNLYKGIWHYVGISDLISIVKASTAGSVMSILFITFIYRFRDHSRVVFIIDWMLTLLFIFFARIIYRVTQEYFYGFQGGRKILIFGAGACGELLLREIKHNKELNYKPVGFIDDDKKKKGKLIHGLPILGGRGDIGRYVREKNIEEIIIAVPSLSKELCGDILETARQFNVTCKSLTKVMDIEKWV